VGICAEELYNSICEIVVENKNIQEAKSKLKELLKNYIILKGDSDPKNYDLQSNIEKFIQDKKTDRLKSRTISNYKLSLNSFASFINKKVNEITKNDIKNFLIYKEKNNKVKSVSTLETLRAYLRVFFDWLKEEDLIIENPVYKVIPYKIPDNYIQELSKEEIEKIRYACNTLREKAIIEILFSTGCKLSEFLNIEVEDINLDVENAEIKLKNDSRGERIVFLFPYSAGILRDYLRSKNNGIKTLFYATKRPYGKLSGRSIEIIITDIINRTDIKKHITPRVFRHTFAKTMQENGCPMNIIQTLLASISTKL